MRPKKENGIEPGKKEGGGWGIDQKKEKNLSKIKTIGSQMHEKGNKTEQKKDKKASTQQQTMGLEWQRGWMMYSGNFIFEICIQIVNGCKM